MKKNENGIAIIAVLLVLIVIGVLAGTGWYVWKNQHRNNAQQNQTPTQPTEAKKESPQSEQKKKVDTTIAEVNVLLKTAADIDKLPAVTPTSFKAFMLEKLQNNKPSAEGCMQMYSISKISAVNIKGGGATVSTTGEFGGECVGGAPVLWVITPDGKWDEVSLNGVVCKSSGGGLVYEEFAAECYKDPNTDSLVKNPNGSIKSLAQ